MSYAPATLDQLRAHGLDTLPGPAAQEIARVALGVMFFLCEKNAAYGNSALEPLRVFSRADTLEQLRVRMDDKLSRLCRGSQSEEDTILDLLGYLILYKAVELRQSERASDVCPSEPSQLPPPPWDWGR